MTREEHEAIKRRCEAATPGPWKSIPFGGEDGYPDEHLVLFPDGEDASVLMEPEAEFIAHARTDVPALVAEVEKLRKMLTEANGYLLGYDDRGPYGEEWKSDELRNLIERITALGEE
jgi:hypothetical protein